MMDESPVAITRDDGIKAIRATVMDADAQVDMDRVDLDAAFDEIYEWSDELACWEQAVTQDEFWAAIERHTED